MTCKLRDSCSPCIAALAVLAPVDAALADPGLPALTVQGAAGGGQTYTPDAAGPAADDGGHAAAGDPAR